MGGITKEVPNIRIGVLGPLYLRVDGQDVPITASKARGVLAFLAIHCGHPVRMSEIATAIWGEDPTSSARKGIQGYVAKLRQVLPDGAIRTDAHGYTLDLEPLCIDAMRFETQFEAAIAEYRDDPETRAERVSEALQEWRGEALLDLVNSDSGRAEATRLEQLRLSAEEEKFDALLAAGKHHLVIGDMMRAARDQPLREERTAQLMMALYRCDRQAEALRCYQDLRKRLADEMGIEPSARLTALEVAILRNDLSLRIEPLTEDNQTDTDQSGPGSLEVEFPKGLTSLANQILLGREAELGLLSAVLNKASSPGAPQMVMVSGESGIGKTSLVAHAAKSAHESGAIVMFARCEEYCAAPYQLFSEAFGRHFEGASRDRTRLLMENLGPELARLFPSMDQSASRRATDPETERHQLFTAVEGLLDDIGSSANVVVVIDDLQWADTASLQLIRHLVVGEEAGELLIIATCRDGANPRSPELMGTIVDINRSGALTRLDLQGLDSSAVLSLMESNFGRDLTESEIVAGTWIHHVTDGNPFFATEMLYQIADQLEHGDSSPCLAGPGAFGTLPRTVSEAIAVRLAKLDKTDQVVLALASVIGQSFDSEVLAAASGRPEEELLGTLELASSASLIREHAYCAGRFEFTHVLVQLALYENMGPTRRALAHQSVAEALERRGSGGAINAAEIARHWSQARDPDGSERALRWLECAADLSLEELSPRDALGYYEQALSLFKGIGSNDRGKQMDLTIGLGIAKRQVGDRSFDETLHEVATMAAAFGDDERLLRSVLANDSGLARNWGRSDPRKIELLYRALEIASDAGTERALLLASLCQELPVNADMGQRIALAESALSLAETTGDDATILKVLIHVIEPTRTPQRLGEALEKSARALDLANKVGTPVLQFLASCIRIITLYCSSEIAEADRLLSDLGINAEKFEQPSLKSAHRYLAACRALLSGDLAEADKYAGEALDLASGDPDAAASRIYGMPLLSSSWQKGSAGPFAPAIAEMSREFVDIPGFSAVLAAAYQQAGNEEEAQRLLEVAADSGFELPLGKAWLTSMILFAEIAVVSGNVKCCKVIYEKLEPLAGQIAFSGLTTEGPVSLYLGSLAAVLGKTTDATKYFEQSLKLTERVGAKFFNAYTQAQYGMMLLGSSSTSAQSRGRNLLGEARTVALKYGYRDLCAGVEKLVPSI